MPATAAGAARTDGRWIEVLGVPNSSAEWAGAGRELVAAVMPGPGPGSERSSAPLR
ncbi:hypothetical protein [Streptomyces sp. NPDC001903]|uniref:hypothetical protein n=1 Tax=Streptomyces sp. NPDC001903 TaxID=3364622 RepID=UPI003697575E